jgi:hypothetical protein
MKSGSIFAFLAGSMILVGCGPMTKGPMPPRLVADPLARPPTPQSYPFGGKVLMAR